MKAVWVKCIILLPAIALFASQGCPWACEDSLPLCPQAFLDEVRQIEKRANSLGDCDAFDRACNVRRYVDLKNKCGLIWRPQTDLTGDGCVSPSGGYVSIEEIRSKCDQFDARMEDGNLKCRGDVKYRADELSKVFAKISACGENNECKSKYRKKLVSGCKNFEGNASRTTCFIKDYSARWPEPERVIGWRLHSGREIARQCTLYLAAMPAACDAEFEKIADNIEKALVIGSSYYCDSDCKFKFAKQLKDACNLFSREYRGKTCVDTSGQWRVANDIGGKCNKFVNKYIRDIATEEERECFESFRQYSKDFSNKYTTFSQFRTDSKANSTLRSAYRKIGTKWHPDKCEKSRKEECSKVMQTANDCREELENSLP